MTKVLAKIEPTTPQKFLSLKEAKLLKETVARSLTDPEFKVFLMVCERTRLDPWKKQIHAVKRWSKKDNKEIMAIQTGIDGYRALAARTGQYAGNDDAVFNTEEGKPDKATVTVYGIAKNGKRYPYTASARWSEYYPGEKQGFQWRAKPFTMLGKCAEALALRKFAPEDLSGIYIDEEMEHTGKVIVEGETIPEEVEEELEKDYQRSMSDDQSVGNTLPVKRVNLLNKLVGKDKRFGTKVAEAKAWVKDIAGEEIMNLTEEQITTVENELAKE